MRRLAVFGLCLVLTAVAWTCGTERGGSQIRALLQRVPTHCEHSVLTVQVTSRLQNAVNIYQARSAADLSNVRSGIPLAKNIASRATEVMCLDELVGQRVRIVVDPVGGAPYLIPGAGAWFADGTRQLDIDVLQPIHLSTLEVR